MNRYQARTLIEANPRRTLVIRFVKRTTGTLRRMVCMYFPEAAEQTTFRFNPVEKGLIAVWDLEKGARRFVNLDGVREIKASGRRLEFRERRAPDRPAARPASGRPEPKEAPEKDRPWEDLEQADREMEALFNTFTL